jgi:hypothetical protein
MVSATTRAQLQRVTDPSGMLLLLKLEHASMATAYVVNDTRDWVINHGAGDITWVGLPFRFKLPNESAGNPARAALEIDNVGRALVDELEALPPGGALQGTFYLVSRATPTVIDSSFSAPLSTVVVTMAAVSAVLGADDELRAPAVKLRYDQVTAPALFEG